MAEMIEKEIWWKHKTFSEKSSVKLVVSSIMNFLEI